MRIQPKFCLLAVLAAAHAAPALARDASTIDVAAQWDSFIRTGTIEDVNASFEALDATGYNEGAVDAAKCRAAAAGMADAQRRVPVSMAVQRGALLCAEALGDQAAADRAAGALAALARKAFAEADRGAWPRPVRIVVPADAYALLASAGLEVRYEVYPQAHAAPYFPLMIAAASPDTGVEKLIQFDYVDVLQALDRASPAYGTPRVRLGYVETFIEGGVKRGDVASIDFMAVKEASALGDPARKIEALRDAATKGGLNAASSWLLICAKSQAKGCADGLVDALLPQAEARRAYPMMLLALAYAEGVGVARDQASAEAMLDAADKVWERHGASLEFGSLMSVLHPDKPLQAWLRQRLQRASVAGNDAAMVMAAAMDLDAADKAHVLSPADEALLASPQHNGMGRGLLMLASWYAERDKTKSDAYMRRAAEANNPAALSILAFRMREALGNNPATPDILAWFEKSANGGDPYAMRYLAYRALMDGKPRRAEDWVIVGALRGDVDSTFFLASLWSGGHEGLSGDAKRAVSIYESLAKVADEGPRARRHLASMALSGTGMPKDAARARALLTQDAEAGDIESQADLGLGLLNGRLGKADSKAGRRWLQRAIDAGSVDAMTSYGIWLHNKGKTPEDHALGVKLTRQAADEGETSALNNLAWILCTSAHQAVRNPVDGMVFVHKLEATPDLDPGTVDTLAACYAATGDFAKAEALQSQVIADMKKLAAPDLDNIKEMDARLALYRAGKTYIEPVAAD